MGVKRKAYDTTVNILRGDKEGIFSTSNPAHMRHMQRLGVEPHSVSFMDDKPVAWVFKFPSEWFKLPKGKKRVSDATKAKMRERFARKGVDG